ncbi:hypothetical protein [Rhizobium sp. CCGE 510]|uniref:hypothetical protein n=1 Tax=Rhizobium sp. CCGE 510 TaxID=1132836 RepID=UPI00027B7F15|nr:hypothetical protein [Rhizobium sp. CCGE 510]EJT03630.1 hypothetical protein RCCGE510_19358 [Rhizobium sp. CCGE 510]
MQTLAALLTPTIAIIALMIAFLQWRTAHQKVVLDLFERRRKVYDEVHNIIVYFWTNDGNLTGFHAGQRLAHAYAESRFLFGEEISNAINSLKATILDLSALKGKLEKLPSDGVAREENIERIIDLEKIFETWPLTFSELCMPYLKLDQRRIRTPMEWLRDRNNLRLSHADDVSLSRRP